MLVSVHPRPYDIAQARVNRAYARYFTRGWRETDVRSSAIFSEILTTAVWSPMRFADGHRCATNFLGARLLVLDFDSPAYPLAQCVKEWCDTAHWIGTTKSHQRDKGGITCDRFRLVVPFVDEITNPDLYHYNYTQMLDRYEADGQVKDVARLYFPCVQVVSCNPAGDLQPVLSLPDGWRRPAQERIAGIVPRWTRAQLTGVMPTGHRNDLVHRIAKDLSRAGFGAQAILEMIRDSPTYGGQLSRKLDYEIRYAIGSAEKAVKREFGAMRRAVDSESDEG